MSTMRTTLTVLLLTITLAGRARAASDELTEKHKASPGLAVAAAALNIVCLPVRLMFTAAGGFLGGFAGFISLGQHEPADAFWALTDGSQIITPAMLAGHERFHFTGYDGYD
ncbi:MAG: hypothetical protein ACRERC_22685 [Candidatus Binatia bacterium]